MDPPGVWAVNCQRQRLHGAPYARRHPGLRARIKVAAFQEGITVAQMLRELLEARFPEREA